MNHDLKDIITLVTHKCLTQIEVEAMNENVRDFLRSAFQRVLNAPYAREPIMAHLAGGNRQNLDAFIDQRQEFINRVGSYVLLK